jgi:hypothetical protein
MGFARLGRSYLVRYSMERQLTWCFSTMCDLNQSAWSLVSKAPEPGAP